jgi:hypothetical protein
MDAVFFMDINEIVKDIGVILGGGWGIYNIWDSIKTKSLKKWRRFIAVGGIAAILIGVKYKMDENKTITLATEVNESLALKIGDINDRSPANIGSYMIGSNGPQFTNFDEYGRFGFEPFVNLFRVYVKNHKLSAFVAIKDKNGKPIATIDGNSWTIFNNEEYEFNSDDSAFEVVTKGDREVFFQIEFRGGIAHLSGYIYEAKNKGICFVYDEGSKMGEMIIILPKATDAFRDSLTPNKTADKLFKYPQSRYSKIEGIREQN